MIFFGTFPLRKPGIFTWFAMLRYARSRSLVNSSTGTSIVSLTVCLSVFSTVVCMGVQPSRHPSLRPRSRRVSLRAMYEEELAFAHEIADRAGEIALGYFRNDPAVTWKPDATPVTEADLAVEAMIREELGRRFPDDAIRGEEGGIEGSSDRMWIVDPIDGTRNYAAGIQIWANLLALKVGDEYVLGMVNAPALGERYAAVRGRGRDLERPADARLGRGLDGRGHDRLRRRRALGRNTPAGAVPGPGQRRTAEPRLRRLLGTHAGRPGRRRGHDRVRALGVGLRAARRHRDRGGRARDAGGRLASGARRKPGLIQRVSSTTRSSAA